MTGKRAIDEKASPANGKDKVYVVCFLPDGKVPAGFKKVPSKYVTAITRKKAEYTKLMTEAIARKKAKQTEMLSKLDSVIERLDDRIRVLKEEKDKESSSFPSGTNEQGNAVGEEERTMTDDPPEASSSSIES